MFRRRKLFYLLPIFIVGCFVIIVITSSKSINTNSITNVNRNSNIRLQTNEDVFDITGQNQNTENEVLPEVDIPEQKPDSEIPEGDDSVVYFRGGRRLTASPKGIYYDVSIKNPNFTLIVAIKFEDLSYISFLSNVWPSPIIASIYLPEQIAINQLQQAIINGSFNSNILLIGMKQLETDVFPQSELHNIAIRSCQTTHYMVIEPGLIIMPTLLSDLYTFEVPPDRVTILPLFFILPSLFDSYCDTSACWNSLLQLLPSSKNKVYELYKNKDIALSLPESKQHLYMHEDWFLYSNTQQVINVTCFDNLFQQPFLIVQNTHATPLYPDKLDQVSYVEHFRLLGYQFQMPMNTFAFISGFRNKVKLDADVFIEWFEEVKNSRIISRVRQCSKAEILVRNKFIKQSSK